MTYGIISSLDQPYFLAYNYSSGRRRSLSITNTFKLKISVEDYVMIEGKYALIIGALGMIISWALAFVV